MPLEAIYTLEELAEHLRVPIDAVKDEITEGNLRAFNVGKFTRVRESDVSAYMGGSKVDPCVRRSTASAEGEFRLNPASDFTFTWPDKKVEQFTDVKEGAVSYEGRTHHVRTGRTVRNSAGRTRRRCLVLVDRYATVEFVAGDTNPTGQMASIIKDRTGKQLPVGAAVPPEYAGLPTGPYRDVVAGLGASNGLAVICDSQDLETMVKHALIRYRYRQERS